MFKKIGLFILLCLIISPCFSAELLVKAKNHWKDSWNIEKIKLLTIVEKEQYDSRSQIGDIIVVKPDGWKWGKEEYLPNYIVVKIPDLKYEDAKIYEEQLYETDIITGKLKLLKKRKHQLSKTIIDNAKLINDTNVEISKIEKDSFIANITVKIK